MHNKGNGLSIKAILYALLIGMMIFGQTVSYMQKSSAPLDLLPIKLVGLYGVCVLLVFLLIAGLRMHNAEKSEQAEKFTAMPRFLLVAAVLVYTAVFFAIGGFASNELLPRLAMVNLVKRTGLAVDDLVVMLSYYTEGLLGISPFIVTGIIFPFFRYGIVVCLFYLLAKKLYPKQNQKMLLMFIAQAPLLLVCCYLDCCDKAILGLLIFLCFLDLADGIRKKQMLYGCLAEIVLILGFIVSFRESTAFDIGLQTDNGITLGRLLIGFLALVILYLFERKDEHAVLFAWYCIAAWFVSLFLPDSLQLSILPIVPLCAYALVCFCDGKQKKTKVVSAAFLILICLLGLCGGLRRGCANNTDDLIPEEYRKMIALLPDSADTKVLAGDDILTCIRAKSAAVNLLYEPAYINSNLSAEYYDAAVRAVHEDLQEPNGKIGNIVRVMEGNQCNYLILPTDADERWAMEQNGFAVVYESQDYVMYSSNDRIKEE